MKSTAAQDGPARSGRSRASSATDAPANVSRASRKPAAQAGAVSLPSLRHDATLGHLAQPAPADYPSSQRKPSKSLRSKSVPENEAASFTADNDPLAPLQEVPMVPTQAWEDYVHAVVWRTGRQYGFQAFNVNPLSRNFRLRQFVPSTMFLASDHLVSLLVKNTYVRDKSSLTVEERFAKAVWTLHGTVFSNYEDNWCPRMQLSARLQKLDQLAQGQFTDPQLVHGMLCELSLYFLMYTEGANLRHTPEAVWFLFWCANTSSQMEALWGAGPPSVVPHARNRRVAMRNAFQTDIVALQNQFQHSPSAPGVSIGDCFKAMVFMEGKVPLPTADKVAAVLTADSRPQGSGKASHGGAPDQSRCDFTSADMGLYEDLIAMGDGGAWYDTVLTPIFYVLSYEMDAQFTAGQEVAFRLGYDDINESLARKQVVMETLKLLGVTREVARSGVVNVAHEAITALGMLPNGGFDAMAAAVFWATKVFNKTMRERRTWFAIYRSFYRIYSLHVILMHLMFAHAFSGSDPKLLSGAVVTHAFMHFAERWSTWWMSREQPNPLAPKKDKKASKQVPQDPEAAAAAAQQAAGDPLAAAAKARTIGSPLEGDPLWGFFGCWEWGIVAVGLLVLYVCQFISAAPPMLQQLSEQYWLFAAGGYTGLMLVHALLTTRDGYSISLTAALRLPRFFTASSARPAAQLWMDGSMKIGGKQWWLLVAFWTQTLVLKGVFDYFIIIRPLVTPVRLLLQRNWLNCPNENYTIMGTELQIVCIDGDWLLIFVRLLPFFLVCLMDTHIFYQITLMIWGVIRGISVLDIGVVGDWESLIKEFHRGPVRWWEKVLSDRGNNARLSLVALKRAQAAFAAPETDSDSGDGFSSGASSEGERSDPATMARARLSKLSSGDLLNTRQQRGVSWKKKGSAKPPSDLSLVLNGQTDEHIAVWDSFAAAWDEIVADLREADLINHRERDNLRFTRLCYDSRLDVSGVRPILMPAFFFAGQIQKVVDLGMVNEQQGLVLSEARSLLVWLGSHLGLLAPSAVTALLGATFAPEVVDLAHQASRQGLLQSSVRLLGALHALHNMRTDSPNDLRRRQTLHAQVAVAVGDILSALEVECQAVRLVAGGSDSARGAGSIKNKHGLGSTQVVQAEALLAILSAMRMQLAADPTPISSALRVLHDNNSDAGIKATWGDSSSSASSSSSAASSMSKACDANMVMKVVGVLSKMLTLTPAAARPESDEAQRILGFFMGSLANKQLTKPVSMDEMMSWTVLTPCYEEDVLYPMDAGLVAQALNCSTAPGAQAPGGKAHNLQDAMAASATAGISSAAAAWGAGGLADLMTETEDRVSLMALLRSVFTTDFENFKERLGERLGVDITGVSEDAFAPGGPLAELALELQLWASYRGQLLARTVRGMMCYDKALRVLARLENPCPDGMSRRSYDTWINELVSSKFSYVVSSQVYGRNRMSRDVRGRWLAEGVDVLLEVFEHLKVAFLDTAADRDGSMQQYSVLITRRSGAPAPWEAGDFVASQRVQEAYRVRLPQNRYSSRGVILGEGKPENQNHAIIFCLGEGLQTIDMNQDNTLAEAYKMRNMLGELAPEVRDAKGAIAPFTLGPRATGAEMRHAQATARAATRPTALVGFCEHIFSDKSGALGSFAASAEFAFGTIVQRTMDTPGNVRMHYGHPDVFNKLHIMTRGGVSKATRQLHISEDIFGGYNHTLRGARIKYREYMSVGKGRDMGFDSINAFEIKISGGAGEVLISRDLWRLATRMDPLRLLHFYFSGCGYYVNTWIICMTVAAQIFSLCFLALARAGEIPVPGIEPADPAYPNSQPRDIITLQDTLKAEYVLQLGTLSLLPYICELALEHGLLKMLVVAIQQVLSGSFGFFVFKQQTTAHYFHDDMAYGGAMYIGTGRGFSITSSQFLKLWTNYSRSHIYPGVELMSMCFLLLAVKDCHYCDYGAMTWGVWLVAASLIFAPFWFNPFVFSTTKVKRDFKNWTAWLRGEVDPDTGITWHQWHRKQMAKIRNDRGNQTTHRANVFFNVISSISPLLLLTLAAVSRLTISIDVAPGPLQSPWILFLVATSVIWALLALTLSTYERLHSRVCNQRSWRLYGFWTLVICVSFVVVYLAVLGRWYSGNGWSNLLLILYSNVNLVIATHRAASHIPTKSPRARALVDSGYLLFDSLVGYSLLCVIGLLSLTGIVAWLQAILLFNPTFAKSIRRGQLVRTIGLAKADPAAQQPQIATIENAVAAVSAASQPPVAVPRSRSASVVAARMQVVAAQVHVDDSVRL